MDKKLPHFADKFLPQTLFRIKGDPKRTHELKVDLECCNYALETVNPHDLANLLKAWLRELSEPLIPFELQYSPLGFTFSDRIYAHHCEVRSRCLTAGNNVRDVLQVVNKLPTINKKTMRYLVDFLRSFLSPEMEAKTKMSATNIAAVFAPNLIRSADNQVPSLQCLTSALRLIPVALPARLPWKTPRWSRTL